MNAARLQAMDRAGETEELVFGLLEPCASLTIPSKEPAGAVITPPIECTTCGALVVGVAALTSAPAEPDTRYGTEQYMRGFNDAKAQFAPAETPPAVAMGVFAIEVEKLLCKKLGIEEMARILALFGFEAEARSTVDGAFQRVAQWRSARAAGDGEGKR